MACTLYRGQQGSFRKRQDITVHAVTVQAVTVQAVTVQAVTVKAVTVKAVQVAIENYSKFRCLTKNT